MVTSTLPDTITLARTRYDVVDFVTGLFRGDAMAWIALGMIAGLIAFFVVYEKVTGRPFVKSKKQRREARKRRKHVLWEYHRDK